MEPTDPAARDLVRRSLAAAQVRVARPTAALARARAFYEGTLGLPVLAAFAGHDGYDGVILGLPDAGRQLELVHAADVVPCPTPEDQLVLYLGDEATVAAIAAHLERHGHAPTRNPNPYWEAGGAVAFTDPDGYWLILSPAAW